MLRSSSVTLGSRDNAPGRETSDRALQSQDFENDLIAAAKDGSRDAFAQIYETHVDRVYAYLLSRLRQASDAEDVTADVFIRAMKGLNKYKPQGKPFIAWLIRIAHNESVNYVKKRARRQETPIVEVPSDSDGPEELTLQKASAGEIVDAMEDITELQREVLQLRFAAELSIDETAESMDRTAGAVKFLQFSALRALRRVMEGRRPG
jgi:RNA polymerase sigma-70 factor, ECF subfamily